MSRAFRFKECVKQVGKVDALMRICVNEQKRVIRCLVLGFRKKLKIQHSKLISCSLTL